MNELIDKILIFNSNIGNFKKFKYIFEKRKLLTKYYKLIYNNDKYYYEIIETYNYEYSKDIINIFQFIFKNKICLNFDKEIKEYIEIIKDNIFLINDNNIKLDINGYIDIIKFLIDNGANININDNELFFSSIQKGYIEIIAFIIDIGKIDIKYYNDKIINKCIEYNNSNLLKYFINKNIEININKDYIFNIYSNEILKILIENNNIEVKLKTIKKLFLYYDSNKNIINYLKSYFYHKLNLEKIIFKDELLKKSKLIFYKSYEF